MAFYFETDSNTCHHLQKNRVQYFLRTKCSTLYLRKFLLSNSVCSVNFLIQTCDHGIDAVVL